MKEVNYLDNNENIRGLQEILKSYQETLVKEKNQFKKYTLIDTGKMPSENFNTSLLPQINEKWRGYNFNSKLQTMICSLDTTNILLIKAYDLWDRLIKQDVETTVLYSTKSHYSYNQYCSHIIYDLKVFLDNIIAITWCLKQAEITGEIDADSVGCYFKDSIKDEMDHCFDSYESFLREVNNLENTYKHSIVNGTQLFLGTEEACIFAIDANRNKDYFNPTLSYTSVSQLISQFNDFYKFSFELINTLSQNN